MSWYKRISDTFGKVLRYVRFNEKPTNLNITDPWRIDFFQTDLTDSCLNFNNLTNTHDEIHKPRPRCLLILMLAMESSTSNDELSSSVNSPSFSVPLMRTLPEVASFSKYYSNDGDFIDDVRRLLTLILI